MLSPDPVTQAPENGQNYNRYSYAFNNPLKYTDPSGFAAKDNPDSVKCNALCKALEWLAENLALGPGFVGVRFTFGGPSGRGHDFNTPDGQATSSGALNHGTEQTLEGGENVPMSGSGDRVEHNDGEPTLLTHIVTEDFGAFAEENPLEFMLFIEFASGYRAIEDGESLDAYMNTVVDDFDAYARGRAEDLIISGLGTLPTRVGEILGRPSSHNLMGALPGSLGFLGSMGSDTINFSNVMKELDPLRQVINIMDSGVALRRWLLEGLLAGEE